MEALDTFAKRENSKIVSLSESYVKGIDINAKKDPWSFLTYYKNADYVVTDTFHGSIFSVIYRKQFISIQRGKDKVSDLLERLQLSSRLVEDNEELSMALEAPIKWESSEHALKELREKSFRYLRDALDTTVG